MRDHFKMNVSILAVVSVVITFGIFLMSVSRNTSDHLTYLALGDSYTSGYNVKYNDNFPSQTTLLLRRRGIKVADPVFIAHAGWTTEKLLNAIDEQNIKGSFSFVTVLTGTNDHSSGIDPELFRSEFAELLKKAIEFTGGYSQRVIVLSLPDWSVTPSAVPFGKERVAREMEIYNEICKEVAGSYQCRFLDITQLSREYGKDNRYLSSDGMHPSAAGYALWSEKLADVICREIEE